MRKKILFLTGLFIIFIASGNAQVKLDYANHALLSGQNNPMTLAGYVDPGPAGTNQLWDFSELKPLKKFTGLLEQTALKKSTLNFVSANTSLQEFGNNFYFHVDQSKIELHGYESSNGNVKIKYDKPFVKMRYPFTYGESFAGTFSGTYMVNELSGPVTGTYNVEADAEGKLILPGNIEIDQTLRVKTIKKYERTLKDRTNEIEIVTYRWYSQNERYPLLVFITTTVKSGSGKSVSHKAAYRDEMNNITSNQNVIAEGYFKYEVYPNPYKDVINMNYKLNDKGNLLIELLDNSGKRLKTILNKEMNAGTHSIEYNAQQNGIVPGLYYIRASYNGEIQTEKVIQIQ